MFIKRNGSFAPDQEASKLFARTSLYTSYFLKETPLLEFHLNVLIFNVFTFPEVKTL